MNAGKPQPKRLTAKQAAEIADKRKRKSMGYTDKDPRCANCKHYKCSIGYENVAQRAVKREIKCKLGDFHVNPHGCCNLWESKSGEKLEEGGKP